MPHVVGLDTGLDLMSIAFSKKDSTTTKKDFADDICSSQCYTLLATKQIIQMSKSLVHGHCSAASGREQGTFLASELTATVGTCIEIVKKRPREALLKCLATAVISLWQDFPAIYKPQSVGVQYLHSALRTIFGDPGLLYCYKRNIATSFGQLDIVHTC